MRMGIAFPLMFLTVLLGCERRAEVQSTSTPQRQAGDPMISITSSAMANGQPVPQKYTSDGRNVSPPLSWTNLPKGTKELALICDDPDAPSAEPWVHWVIYKLSANLTSLPENVPHEAKLASPPGALQGKNSWGSIGYRGPEPPRGHGVHHYHFRLYALDAPLQVQSGLDKTALLKAMTEHVLAEGELVGTYER
jgi:Raf kinase inhibitor-like YbhB/YbcL family protein